MEWRNYIVSDKGVLLGKPTVKGTRLSVDHLLSLFAQGWTEDEVLENYPRLTKDSLQAIFAYVYECMQDSSILTLKKSS